MTRAITFTQAQVRRAVKAAEKAGMKVTRITVNRDGSIGTAGRPMTAQEINRRAPLIDLKEAIEISRCADAGQFKSLVREGIFPAPAKRGKWDKVSLQEAVAAAEIDTSECRRFSEVYFLKAERFVKIGFSNGTSSRLIALQTASPFEINLIGAIRGSLQIEQALHVRFSHLRHRGEWFRETPGLMAFIQWILARQSEEEAS